MFIGGGAILSVRIAGVGMTPFYKPSAGYRYEELAEQAVREALTDAGVALKDVQQAYASYVLGDSTCGQAALYRVGLTGLPVMNVNNNCSSGSSALWLARQAVLSGQADVVLAFGFEQMRPGALVESFTDRLAPSESFRHRMRELDGEPDEAVPLAAQFFAGAGTRHMELFGTSPEAFASIAVKARRHGAQNKRAVFREQLTIEEVLASPQLQGPLTRLQACPPTSGAAATVVVSEEFARRRGLTNSVRIAGQTVTSDTGETYCGDMRHVVGFSAVQAAAALAFEEAGIGPDDIRVAELHDCFTTNELLAYEALGFTPEGTAEKMIADGDNTYGGRVVTNPSGGLISRGHPLGATGLAQCAELVWQLRGECGSRQVEGVTTALQYNMGLGSAYIVSIYEKADCKCYCRTTSTEAQSSRRTSPPSSAPMARFCSLTASCTTSLTASRHRAPARGSGRGVQP